MLPGKRYTPEDIVAIFRKKIWIVLVPLASVSAATAMYVRELPDKYRSEALIQLQTPRLQVSLLKAPSTPERLGDRLPAIQQRLYSRTTLETVVQDLNLYPEERRAGTIMEDIIERLRGSITLAPVRGDSFRIVVIARDPRTAMRVADKLTSLVINESERDRHAALDSTDTFLESQLTEARGKLIDHEKKLEEYRRKFNGELPTQVSSNLQAVTNRTTQIQALTASINRDQESRLLLERQVADLSNATDVATSAPGPVGPGSSTAQQVNAARAQLAQMQQKLKADHPDVQAQKRQVRDLELQLENEALQAPITGDGRPMLSAAEQKRQRDLADLRGRIELIDRQVARNQTDVQRLREEADTFFKRAEAGPARETEMVELNRDYNTLQGVYLGLLSKREEANIAGNLASREFVETLKLLDAARLPQRPFSPDRPMLNGVGAAAGLVMGLVFIGFREYRNDTLQVDDEVTDVLGLPVLAVVPVMESEREHQRRNRRRLITNVTLGSTVFGCVALIAYTLLR